MGELDSLKESLRQLEQQLAAKKAERQRYFDIAEEIETIYNRMAEDKDALKNYRSNVKTFGKEDITTFKGKLYTESYKQKIQELLDDYDTVIDNLDSNMDQLNTLRADYENKGYQCNGPIGYLQSSVNSLIHTIQNWIN